MINKYHIKKEKKESIMTKNETTSAIVLARKKAKRDKGEKTLLEIIKTKAMFRNHHPKNKEMK